MGYRQLTAQGAQMHRYYLFIYFYFITQHFAENDTGENNNKTRSFLQGYPPKHEHKSINNYCKTVNSNWYKPTWIVYRWLKTSICTNNMGWFGILRKKEYIIYHDIKTFPLVPYPMAVHRPLRVVNMRSKGVYKMVVRLKQHTLHLRWK